MSTAHFATLANWHTHLNRHATSLEMRDWLMNRESLTSRLMTACGLFQVQLLQQQAAQSLSDEFGEIGLTHCARVMERDVLLRCDGVAVVYAHTVLPMTSNASQWPLFSSLGNKSLGTTLFNDPSVDRGPLHFALLRPGHPLMQRIAKLNLFEVNMPSLYARRSLFTRRGSSLLVTEIFLPTINTLRASGGCSD